MARWLVKTEPSDYSWADLVRDGQTSWDGVSNALALKHLAAMRRGDEVLLYHTGREKAAVGVASVARPAGDGAGVRLKAGRALKRPVTLAEIKREKSMAGWELVRMGRLSVMPVPQDVWRRIVAMAGE